MVEKPELVEPTLASTSELRPTQTSRGGFFLCRRPFSDWRLSLHVSVPTCERAVLCSVVTQGRDTRKVTREMTGKLEKNKKHKALARTNREIANNLALLQKSGTPPTGACVSVQAPIEISLKTQSNRHTVHLGRVTELLRTVTIGPEEGLRLAPASNLLPNRSLASWPVPTNCPKSSLSPKPPRCWSNPISGTTALTGTTYI
jgi:hypothetical protein